MVLLRSTVPTGVADVEREPPTPGEADAPPPTPGEADACPVLWSCPGRPHSGRAGDAPPPLARLQGGQGIPSPPGG